MNLCIQLRRSVLYVPSANQRALDKAKSLPADALVFDLEDAVDPAAKQSARGKHAPPRPADHTSIEN